MRLCAKKFECEVYNATQLMDMEGDVFTYKAVSEGKQSELNRMVVPEVLHLKVGCSVLLVKSLSKSLVNGMRGIVKECRSDSVVVEFSGTGVNGTKTATIKRETFSVYNMEEGKVIASRFQLPLTLGYSMPIHKAQGLTLDRVVVDATNIFSPGQLGVAIGRATCKKGLRLIGFRQSELLPASPDVTKFYKRFSTDFSDSFECCKYSVSVIDNLPTDYEDNYVSSDEESEFSDTEIYDLDGMFPELDILPGNQSTEPEGPSCSVGENSSSVSEQIDELPFSFSKLESLFSETVSTQKQAAIRAHLNEIKNNESFKACLNKISCDISKILVENCGDSTKKTEPKHWTAFYYGMYKPTISDQYLDYLRAFYGNVPSDLVCDDFGKVVDKLIEIILEERIAPILESTPPIPIPVAITGAGLGNIRYIEGRCIAKAKYHLMKSLKANLYKPKRKHDVNESFTKVRMLDYLTTRSSETKHKESLNDTERRQNLGRGLTSISDDCFAFFLSLNKINMQHQTDQNLQIYGPDVFSKTKESALNNKGLRQSWDSMFENYKVPDAAAAVANEIRNSLLHDIISRFLRIGNNQFRKDSIRKMGKKKTESLRKKVVVEKSQTIKLHRVRDGLDGEAKSGKKRQVRTEINESVAGPSEDSREKGKKRKQNWR